MNTPDKKTMLKNTFNDVCTRYDNPELKFFATSARSMVSRLNLRGDERVFDVATGTGSVALEIAKSLPRGEVVGVDFSSGMLAQAQRKAHEAGITNIDFREGDIESLDFPDRSFDIAVCSFGIFFTEDMSGLLEHICTKVKKGGKVIVSTFADGFLKPGIDLFTDRIRKYGIAVPYERPSQRVATADRCRGLFENAGLKDISVNREKHGYFVENPENWWNLIQGAALSSLVKCIPEEKKNAFKREHMAEIADIATPDGIWLEVDVLYTAGKKSK